MQRRVGDGPKVIVLTGCTRGLGRALADGFIGRGHTVVGCGTNTAALDELHGRHPSPHRFDRVDVADDHAVHAWARRVLAEVGTPDLVVNNAAVINSNAPLWEIPAVEFDRLTAVNVNGTANVIRRFVPAMVERGQGVIVNFSSGWGRSTSAEVAPYCASKWAIEGLTKALADELPSGMAAVPLNPGVIDTEMLRSCFGAAADRYPTAGEWAERGVPFILQLGPADNGCSATAP